MTEPSSQPAPSSSQLAGQPSSAQPVSGSETPQPNSQPTATDRPEYVPEKFWDPEKKAPKIEEVFKSYTELEKKIGQPRFDFPAADAKPEVRAEFMGKLNAYLGVPEKPDGYGLTAPEGYPEHMGEYMKDTLTEYSAKAHELGLSPAQAKGIQEWFDGMALKLGEAQTSATTAETDAANARMDGHFSKLFGDQKDVAVQSVKQAMTTAIPDAAVRADLEKALPNEALVVIAALDKYYKTKYGASDNNLDDPSRLSGKTPEDLRQEAQKLMASPEYRDPMHKDHKATKEKADQLYKDIAALTDAAKRK